MYSVWHITLFLTHYWISRGHYINELPNSLLRKCHDVLIYFLFRVFWKMSWWICLACCCSEHMMDTALRGGPPQALLFPWGWFPGILGRSVKYGVTFKFFDRSHLLSMGALMFSIIGQRMRHQLHHIFASTGHTFLLKSPWCMTYDFENKAVFSASFPSHLAEWFSQKNWHIKPDNISNLSLPRKWLPDKNKYSLCSIYSIRTEQGISFNTHRSANPILLEFHLAFM